MTFFTKVMDRLGYEVNDERFIKEFIQEQERVFRKSKYQYDGKRRYDEISTYYINPSRERYLRIKKLKNAINQKSEMIQIEVEEGGVLISKKNK